MAPKRRKRLEDPALLARRAVREAILSDWFTLKRALARWATPRAVEIVSGIELQMRVRAPGGETLKVWLKPGAGRVFLLAVGDRIEASGTADVLLARLGVPVV